jgi:hypothetical protein
MRGEKREEREEEGCEEVKAGKRGSIYSSGTNSCDWPIFYIGGGYVGAKARLLLSSS